MGFSSGKNVQNNINTTEAQTISNKTLDNSNAIDGASIDNSTVTGASIVSPERSDVKKDTLANLQTYAATASNGQLVHATDVKKTFQILDGSLAEVGGGSAGINYVENSDAETDLSGWNKYADAASEIPEDGQGGTDNIQLARATGSPLRGTASFVMTKFFTNVQGQGVAYPFEVDDADLAKKLTISFDYDTNQYADYTDGKVRVYVIQADDSGFTTNVKVIRVNGEDLMAGKGTHYAQFQTDAAAKHYKLVLHIASDDTNIWSVAFDNVQVGPRELAKGTVVTDWKDYTPSIQGLGTTSNLDFKYRRVGDTLEVQGKFTTGTTTATEAQIGIPSGLSISSSFGTSKYIGNLGRVGTSTSIYAVLGTSGDTYFNIGVRNSGTGAQLTPSNGSSVLPNSSDVSIMATVPIQGWSSDAVMSEDLGGREVVCRVYRNAAAQSISNGTTTTVDFDTVQEDTTASFNDSTNTFTAPESGYYDVNASLLYDPITDGALMQCIVNVNGVGALVGQLNQSLPTYNQTITAQGILKLEKGDEVIVRTYHVSGASKNIIGSSSRTFFHIAKRSSPQTVLETETVAARYTSNSGQTFNATTNTTILFDNLVKDTHNSYNTSTGVYTVPVSGFYQINAKFGTNSTAWGAGAILESRIKVNGTNTASEFMRIPTSISTSYMVSLNQMLYLEKGDSVVIEGWHNGTSTSLTASNIVNNLSIARIK
jgi:hypothetical protein